jgi:hypothetical protein
MRDIASRGGRFITVLPATRKENTTFRATLVERPDAVAWRELYQVVDEEGNLENVLRVCTDEHLTKEGFRLLWFHSRSKQTSDAATRATRLQRAIRESHLPELPLYPEGRPCSRPTTRRVLDYFAPLSTHTLTAPPPSLPTTITTELTPLHRRILQLLGIPATAYDQ